MKDQKNKKQEQKRIENNEMLTDYIKNPVEYLMLDGDCSRMQQQIRMGLIFSLQDKINEYLVKKHEGQQPASLFVDDDFEGGEITFRIPLAELGIRPDAYEELDATCEDLLSKNYKRETDDAKEYVNIFSSIKVPKTSTSSDGSRMGYTSGKRRLGYIEIKMVRNRVDEIISMKRGYIEHMIAVNRFKSKYANPLYEYLSRFRHMKTKDVDYTALKDFYRMITWSKDFKEIIEEKYPKYQHFCSNVLDKCKEEMDNLFEQGQIDLTFTYEPIYAGVKKRGRPDKIRFHILYIDKRNAIQVEGKTVEVEEEKPEVNERPTYKEWDALATAASEANRKWWETFGTCCQIVSMDEYNVSIGVPSNFVYENWESNLSWLGPIIKQIFGNRKIGYKIISM